MKTVVICGGHLSAALAVMEKLPSQDYWIFYFGRKRALEGDKSQSLEYFTIRKLGIPFRSITTARLQRSFTIYTLPSLLKFPKGLIQSFLLLLRLKPKIVVSFGGYLALPVCCAAWILRIPIITHEQTRLLGLSNKIISKLAQVLCLSFKDTSGIPAGVKTIYTGNLIRQSILANKNKKILDFGDKKLPLLYITGGSLGSQTLNHVVGQILDALCSKFRILHQCGNADDEADFRNLLQLKNRLPKGLRQNYTIVKQIDPSSVGIILRNTQLVIGRAGANTVAEILFFGIPAILIPLPWAGQNEQQKNALMVKMVGLGEIIDQSRLTPEFLLDKINLLTANIDSYRRNAVKAKKLIPLDGAGQIVKLIDAYCG